MDEKIVPFSEIEEIARPLKEGSKLIVTSNGCFDVLHWGHISYLQKAKALGHVLWVGINADSSVRKLKGPTRPIFSEAIRARQLAALECVDFVTIFEEDTPLVFLEKVQPAIHVKGADYANKPLPEKEIVESFGGKIELIDFVEGLSTSNLIETLKLFTDEDRPARS